MAVRVVVRDEDGTRWLEDDRGWTFPLDSGDFGAQIVVALLQRPEVREGLCNIGEKCEVVPSSKRGAQILVVVLKRGDSES